MKKILKNIVCFIIIIVCLVTSYNLLKKHYEKNMYVASSFRPNIGIEPVSILRHALVSKDWSNISLSKNFRNKYKSKYDIIPDAKKYKVFDGGYSYINGKKVISISSDVIESIFDLYDEKTVTTEFYFDYNVNENNELDDIELIKTRKYKTFSCEPIDE